MYSKVEISNIVFRGVEVKKSEIRLKSENLHPCVKYLVSVPRMSMLNCRQSSTHLGQRMMAGSISSIMGG